MEDRGWAVKALFYSLECIATGESCWSYTVQIIRWNAHSARDNMTLVATTRGGFHFESLIVDESGALLLP